MFIFLDKTMDRFNFDQFFSKQQDESDDYYAILGCDELSNVNFTFYSSIFVAQCFNL